jgi:hypothetical protein
MKKIGFIGAYDKTDLLLNIAKVLTVMNYRVLVVDSTINQKARYVVPAIDPTVSYITSFEDMDVAVGFNNVLEIQRYIGTTGELPYDILLIDCDTIERVEQFELEKANKNYFVTSFDVYSLKRGLEILSNITVPIKLTKTIFTKEVLKEDDEYLNYLSLGYKIIWEDERIYFPIENGDSVVITENQRLQKIKLKKISLQYKESMSFIIQQVLDQNNDSNIRKAIKTIEKGA